MDHADTTNDVGLLPSCDATTTGIDVVIADGRQNIFQANIIAEQRGGIEDKLIFPREPAEIINADHSWYVKQGRNNRPFLDVRQLHQVLVV